MRQYVRISGDGKVLPGRTILIDVARTYDVLSVVSGKMHGPEWPRRIGASSIGICGLYGGSVRWTKED